MKFKINHYTSIKIGDFKFSEEQMNTQEAIDHHHDTSIEIGVCKQNQQGVRVCSDDKIIPNSLNINYENKILSNECNLKVLFWIMVTIIVMAFWSGMMLRYWPITTSITEDVLMFILHIIFMDLVPNWFTGYLLHRISCFRDRQHKWEHRVTNEGKLSGLFMLTSIYGIYGLLWMFFWVIVIGCGVFTLRIPGEGLRCSPNFESAMWIASFSYTLSGLILRLILWVLKRRNLIYHSENIFSQFLLNMARYYWIHFDESFEFQPENRREVFGAQTPFWDVIFGTCPFDIPWSTPIPYIDFFVTDPKVFETVLNPKYDQQHAFKWSTLQILWHTIWIFVILGMLIFLPLVAWTGN